MCGIAFVNNLRFYIGIMTLITGTASASAQTSNDSWYISASHGIPQVENITYTIGGVRHAAVNDLHTGERDVDFAFGRQLGKMHIEIEAGYKTTRIHHYYAYIGVPVELGTAPPGTYNDATGHIRVVSSMLDFGYDLLPGKPIVTVSGGIGLARVQYDHFRIGGPKPFLNSRDFAPAWQMALAARMPIMLNLELGVKYRYFGIENIAIRGEFANDLYESKFRSHSMLGVLLYRFRQ